jgi:nucleoid DNA-binding protein
MLPKSYLKKIAANVSKRCAIALPTVLQVLPAFIDEVRYQLAEGSYPCVPIESFGTFAVINRPEHEYLYNYKGANQVHVIPARRQLKFKPAASFQREIETAQYDPTRKSFSRHPDDKPIKKRNDMRYKKGKFYQREKGACSRPLKKTTDDTDSPD